MRDFLQNNALALMIILLALGLIIFTACMYQEVMLRARRRINYSNYSFFSKQYSRRINYFLLIGGIATAIFGIVCFALFVGDPVINIYLWCIVPVVITSGVVVYLALTPKKYNKDLSSFDQYHEYITSQLGDTALMQQKIAEGRAQLGSTIGEIAGVMARLKVKPDADPRELFADAESILSAAESNVIDMRDEAQKLFSEKLDGYIKNDIAPGFTLVQSLDAFDKDKFALAIAAAKAQFFSGSMPQIMTNLSSGMYTSLAELTDIASLPGSYGQTLTLDAAKNLLQAANGLKNPYPLVSLLVSGGAVKKAELLKLTADNDYHWCFGYTLIRSMTERDVADTLGSLIANDQKRSCLALLTGLSHNHTAAAEQAVNLSHVHNDTYKISSAYLTVLRGSAPEQSTPLGLAMALRDYYRRYATDSDGADTIGRIIHERSFAANKDTITKTYANEYDKIRFAYLHVSEVYSIYLSCSVAENNILSNKKVAGLIREYMSNLRVRELNILGLLMGALVLTLEYDRDIVGRMYDCITSADSAGRYSFMRGDIGAAGKKLLSFLLGSDINGLLTVLGRAEQHRLAYLRLKELV